MNACTILQKLDEGELSGLLAPLYGADGCIFAGKRLRMLVQQYEERFGGHEISVFSAPGRVELGGNHTDHQRGRVLAASVSTDVLAVAAPNGENVVRIVSEGFPDTVVDLADLTPHPEEFGTTAALVRGCAAGMVERGIVPGGFNACMTSDIPSGGGLSSSAAFEVLTAGILNRFFAESRFSPVHLAQIGQYAENVYFGKPSGLMDQCASAVGGVVQIDFRCPEAPEIETVPFDFENCGYTVCAVDSGASHADLTAEYAAIPEDLAHICAFFRKNVLREVDETQFYENLPALRAAAGDRAVLRAMHVFDENRRVTAEAAALRAGDLPAFLRLVCDSGDSSALFLQNITPCGAARDQALALTLALCRRALDGRGAYRVHGGGFAGSALVFVPNDRLDEFRATVEHTLGSGACRVLRIRAKGFAQLL